MPAKTANEQALLVDSNVWIALTFNSHPGHQAASDAMQSATEDQPAVFCRATQQSFLRLISTPVLVRQYGVGCVTNEDALALFDRFMQSPLVAYRDEPAGLLPLWRQLAGKSAPAPRLWMDAYLAAFAIAAGLRVVTLDNDFASFQQAGLELLVLKTLGS